MNAKNISAEEKLLRLIKGRAKKDAAEEQRLPSQEKQSVYKLSGSYKVKTPQITFTKLFLDYSLMVASLILGAYLVVQFVTPKPISFLEKQTIKDATEFETYNATEAEIPYEFFVKNINNRKLFSASFSPKENPQQVDTKKLSDLIKNISLVGIISKQNGFMAIIEDRQVGKNYFLYEGDSMGELLIKHIEEGKITLDYYGQEMDLYL